MDIQRRVLAVVFLVFAFQSNVFAVEKDFNESEILTQMYKQGGAKGLPLTPKDDKWGEPNNGFITQLIPQSNEYVVGKPMHFGLVMKNVSDSVKHYEHRPIFMHPLIIIDANDNEAYYKKGPFQTNAGPTRSIDSSEVVTLFDNLNITDDYVIIEPGKYTIQFRGGSFFPPSNIIEFEVEPGTPDERDDLIASLVDILPDPNWQAMMGPRQNIPAGRKDVEGTAVVLFRIRSRIRVMLWQTKTSAEVDEQGEDPQTSDYLGRNGSGYFYITIPPKALDYWPKMREDIAKALKLDSQSVGLQ